MLISPLRYVKVTFIQPWFHYLVTKQFHTLRCHNIIFLPLIDLTLLVWFYNYYSFKLLHENYTLFSLKSLFSNLTFVYFWDVVSHYLHLLPQYHQSHLHLACLHVSHLCHLPQILFQVPLIPQLDYHLWHNVSFDTISNDLEVCWERESTRPSPLVPVI